MCGGLVVLRTEEVELEDLRRAVAGGLGIDPGGLLLTPLPQSRQDTGSFTIALSRCICIILQVSFHTKTVMGSARF